MKSILLFVGGAVTGVVMTGIGTFVVGSAAVLGVSKHTQEILDVMNKVDKETRKGVNKATYKTGKKSAVKKKASIFTKGKATAKAA
jgi:hypothetical protein